LIFPALELSNVNNSLFSVCALSLIPLFSNLYNWLTNHPAIYSAKSQLISLPKCLFSLLDLLNCVVYARNYISICVLCTTSIDCWTTCVQLQLRYSSIKKSFSVSALTSSYPTIWTLTLRKRERQACHNLYVLAKLKDVHFTTAAINVQIFLA
jgi:hypothetical protein